jgi:2-keto-3-deoxy-L-rhamnonate aldolase RhmA
MKRTLKSFVSAGIVPLGMQIFSGSPALIEIASKTGFDFVMIDMEHACLESGDVEMLVRTCDAAEIIPLVRVAENHPTAIRKALEAGACGVKIPRVRTASEVEAALAAARYPPVGTRGMCPATRASGYSVETWDAFVRWTNEEISVIPLIELPEAVERIDEICSIEGIDIISFGPGDLGMALGAGAAGMTDPRVAEAFDRVLQAAARADVAVMGVPFPDLSARACEALLQRGVRVLLHSVDEFLFFEKCQSIVTDLAPVLSASTSKRTMETVS